MKKILFCVVIGFFLLGACSKSEEKKDQLPSAQPPAQASAPKSSAGKAIDPCSLLTLEEASEILGTPAKAPERKDAGFPLGMVMCLWEPAGELEGGLIQVSVIQTENISEGMRAAGYTAERLYRDSKAQMGGQPVPGIGEDAYFEPIGGLNFLKNGIQVSVSAGSSAIMKKGEQGLPAAKKVAEKVSGRI